MFRLRPHKQVQQKKPIQMQRHLHLFSSCSDLRYIIHSTNNQAAHYRIPRSSLPLCPVLGFNLQSGEGALLSLLVPLLGPNARADGDGHLSHVLASVLVALGRLEAEEPLVVSVPAVVGLVLRGKSRVAGSRADVLDDVEPGGILGRQLRHGFGEDFVDLGHICVLIIFDEGSNRTNR